MSSNSMLIGFDATPLQEERSGIGVYTENLVRALAATGQCEVMLLSNRSPAPQDGLEGLRRHEGGRFPVRAVWLQTVLPRVLSRLGPELCHFPNYLAPLRAPCPRVVTLHDMALYRHPEFFSHRKRHLSRRLLPHVVARAEGLITVSEFSRREIVELLGVPRRRVHVIYEAAARDHRPVHDPAVLETVRRRYALPDRFVLFAGTIEPRKNIARLLTAFESLSERGGSLARLQLVLVGASGWKNRGLRARIREAQARGRLLDLGYFPREDLPALYSLADVVAYPSIYEGFGLPAVEAMACGTPVLTSNRASMAEVAGSAAWLVDPDDVESIRHGLEMILCHADVAAELSSRGRERAARFSWTEAAGRTLEVYREVLSRARVSRARANGCDCCRDLNEPRHTKVPSPDLPASRLGDFNEPISERSPDTDGAALRRSILRTVIYADLFESPIDLDALHRFLIGCRASRSEVESCLSDDPWIRERVVRIDGVVVLKGREALATRQISQRAEVQGLVQQNRRLLRLLSAIPFLRMLSFSGGTSHENSLSHQDLDLFLIAERGRIWTVYGLVVLLARLARRRKIICANYLIDSDHLRLPRTGDLFTAHELLFLKPLAGEPWADRLMASNPWIHELFPNAGTLSREHLSSGYPRLQRAGEILLAPIWPLFERASKRLFGRRIVKHARAASLQTAPVQTASVRADSVQAVADRAASVETASVADVILDDGILKLHIQDRRAPALERFHERLKQAGVWDSSFERCLRVDTPCENDVAAVWDSMAADYDRSEASNVVLRSMRRRFREELENWIDPGARVLDLGCGTGIDTLWLLDQGHDVTAVDLSPSMIRMLREKEAGAHKRGRGQLETHVLSLDQLERLVEPNGEQGFDAALADFGSLNCVRDPESFARALARLVRPGGHVVAAVMNRVCLWEILYHVIRFRPRSAFRRFGAGARSASVSGGAVDVWYPTPRAFAAPFLADFDLVRVRPHGLVIPPPYLDQLAARWPRVYQRLEMWEDRSFHWKHAAALADHFVIVLRRSGAPCARNLAGGCMTEAERSDAELVARGSVANESVANESVTNESVTNESVTNRSVTSASAASGAARSSAGAEPVA